VKQVSFQQLAILNASIYVWSNLTTTVSVSFLTWQSISLWHQFVFVTSQAEFYACSITPPVPYQPPFLCTPQKQCDSVTGICNTGPSCVQQSATSLSVGFGTSSACVGSPTTPCNPPCQHVMHFFIFDFNCSVFVCGNLSGCNTALRMTHRAPPSQDSALDGGLRCP
jgi:hypothetical protein